MTTKLKIFSIAIIATLFSSTSVFAKDKAPTIIKQELIIDASIDMAWLVLGPQFADAYKWASSIKHSEARDNKSINGSTCSERGCNVKGIGDIKEKLLQYSEAEHSLSYQVYEGMPKMVKYAVNNWKLISTPDGKTKLEMQIEMKTGGMMGKMMKGTMKRKMTKLSKEVAEEFKYFVETERPHPRKIKATSK